MRSDPIRGKTVRWSYEDGPTAGTRFEHTFAPDGTVTYRMLDGQKDDGGGGKPSTKGENPRYQVARVNDDVYAVSYLAPSGFTLTSVLDLDTGTVVSFASNEKELFVQHGTFEVAERVT